MAAKKAATKKAVRKPAKKTKKRKIIKFTKANPWTGTQWRGETPVSMEFLGYKPGTFTLLLFDIGKNETFRYPIADFIAIKFKSGAYAAVPVPDWPADAPHTPGSIQAWIRNTVNVCGITGESFATKDTRTHFQTMDEFDAYCKKMRPKLLKQYKQKPLKVAKHHVPSNER